MYLFRTISVRKFCISYHNFLCCITLMTRMSGNSNNIHFSGIGFICSPYLAMRSLRYTQADNEKMQAANKRYTLKTNITVMLTTIFASNQESSIRNNTLKTTSLKFKGSAVQSLSKNVTSLNTNNFVKSNKSEWPRHTYEEITYVRYSSLPQTKPLSEFEM